VPKISAGLLMYRRRAGHLEVLLAHPGGPFWTNKDEGAWTIPKGVLDPGEDDPFATAKREFEEELGAKPSATEFIPLGEVRQKAGKTVIAWAFEGDLDPSRIESNTFKAEWPPRSGRWQDFPEVDRAEFFSIAEARTKINPAQGEFLSRLEALVSHPARPAQLHE
jgi:predicted NUDIX family NTP pyrophosphohydrolase